MKNNISVRPLISASLLLSTLALLSGCAPLEWFKSKTGCESCGHAESAANLQGEVLMSMRGKPVITTGSYQEYWDEFIKNDPQAEAMLPFMPNARHDMFKSLETEKLIQEWIKAQKIDQKPEYQKKQKKQRELADRLIAIQAFQEDILSKIDTSNEALEKFYSENRSKSPIFQQAPFLESGEGVKAQSVEFTDEKQAKDFLAKAKESNGDFATVAKTAKKDVKDLGVVSAQSRIVDPAVRAKVKDMQPNTVELIPSGKNFIVVKALSKESAKYAPFEDVKEAVKQVMNQTKFTEALQNRIEELKKEFDVKDDSAKDYFDKEREKDKAEMQEKLKALQAQEAKPEAEAEKSQQADAIAQKVAESSSKSA